MFDFIDLWHARLRHVNLSYIKKMNYLGLISSLNYSSMNKYEIYVEAKITKKIYASTKKKTELLSLIHTKLEDLKQFMIRGDKKYYVTFIVIFSRYAKLYFLRSKAKIYNIFLLYKTKVKNQLNKKIKRAKSDKKDKYVIIKV